jgi:hypothetical protein
MVFPAFFGGFGLKVTFYMPAQVFKMLALAPMEGSLIDSSPGGRAEIGIAEIGISPLKLGTEEMKLSKTCIQTKEM